MKTQKNTIEIFRDNGSITVKINESIVAYISREIGSKDLEETLLRFLQPSNPQVLADDNSFICLATIDFQTASRIENFVKQSFRIETMSFRF